MEKKDMAPYPSPEGEARLGKAAELLAEGNLDAAISEYKALLEAKLRDVQCHIGLGAAYRLKAESEPLYLKPALHHLREAVKLDPGNEEAHNQYILAACRAGMLTELREEYAKLSREYPANAVFKQLLERLNVMLTSPLEAAGNPHSREAQLETRGIEWGCQHDVQPL